MDRDSGQVIDFLKYIVEEDGIQKEYRTRLKNKETGELLEEFIDWARDCGEDAWYIFDNTDEAIERFMAQRDYGDEFLGDAGS